MDDKVKEYQSDAERNELLIWAAARGLFADLAELINQGADPKTKDKKGRQPVHYAAAHGHAEVLEYLSSKGADLDAEDPAGRTPLHHAALGSRYDTVKMLVKRGVWVDAYDAEDDTALHMAARQADVAVVKLLVSHSASLAPVNKAGLTPLSEALLAGRMEAVKYLHGEKQCKVQEQCRGYPLLHLAAGLGCLPAVEWLLGPGGCDPGMAAAGGLTPLHAAAVAGSPACTELIIGQGVDASRRTSAGEGAADLAGLMEGPGEEETRVVKAMINNAITAGAKKGGKSALKPAAAPAAPAAPPSAAAAEQEEDESLPFSVRFARLPKSEQLRKVELYARMSVKDLAELSHMRGNELYLDTIAEVSKTYVYFEGYKVIAAMHADESFQEDASNPQVRDAIEALKASDNLEAYAGDSRMRNVLGKLKKMHNVMKEMGGLRVTLDDVLVVNHPNWREEDPDRLKALQLALDTAKERAVGVLCGGESPRASMSKTNEAAATARDAPMSATMPAAASATVPPVKEKKTVQFKPVEPRHDESAEGGVPKEESEEERLEKINTWRELLWELAKVCGRQTVLSLIMAGVMVAIMWTFGLLPYQRLARRAALKAAASLQSAVGSAGVATPMPGFAVDDDFGAGDDEF